ncbi:hypothetical protein Tco_1345653 [Tanacetum coccineum]
MNSQLSACLGESSTGLGDPLGSPRVAPLFFYPISQLSASEMVCLLKKFHYEEWTAPTAGRQQGGGPSRVASSPDSDLEAFSHNPAHGSFAPLAFQPSAMTNCVNQRKSESERSKSNVAMISFAAQGHLSQCDISDTSSFKFRSHLKDREATLSTSMGRNSHCVDPQGTIAMLCFNLNSRIPLSVTSLSWLFDRRGRPERAVPRTSLAYIVPSTRGCSPWRPDAVMSTTGRGRHSVTPDFSRAAGANGHRRQWGALPAAGPYLRLSRFQGGQAVKQKR